MVPSLSWHSSIPPTAWQIPLTPPMLPPTLYTINQPLLTANLHGLLFATTGRSPRTTQKRGLRAIVQGKETNGTNTRQRKIYMNSGRIVHSLRDRQVLSEDDTGTDRERSRSTGRLRGCTQGRQRKSKRHFSQQTRCKARAIPLSTTHCHNVMDRGLDHEAEAKRSTFYFCLCPQIFLTLALCLGAFRYLRSWQLLGFKLIINMTAFSFSSIAAHHCSCYSSCRKACAMTYISLYPFAFINPPISVAFRQSP